MFNKTLAEISGIDLAKIKPPNNSGPETKVFKSAFDICKSNDEKMQVFGWGLVSAQWEPGEDGQPVLKQLIDHQKDIVDEDEMEKIAYQFVLKYRNGGDMHVDDMAGTATCIESVCMTIEKQQAMGIPTGVVPVGWWLGFQIHEPDLWDLVKKGQRGAFSIEGTAVRQKVEIEPEEIGNFSLPK